MSPGTSEDPLGARQGRALTHISHPVLVEQAGVVTIADLQMRKLRVTGRLSA